MCRRTGAGAGGASKLQRGAIRVAPRGCRKGGTAGLGGEGARKESAAQGRQKAGGPGREARGGIRSDQTRRCRIWGVPDKGGEREGQ